MECVCTMAGWCERNRFHVTERELHLCQTREDYRKAFASGNAAQHRREAKLQGKPPPPPSEATAERFPCLHRLAVIETRLCNLCGLKGQAFEVFGCALHGECSIGKKHSKVKACVACRERITAIEAIR